MTLSQHRASSKVCAPTTWSYSTAVSDRKNNPAWLKWSAEWAGTSLTLREEATGAPPGTWRDGRFGNVYPAVEDRR
jgi:hypothetical protein